MEDRLAQQMNDLANRMLNISTTVSPQQPAQTTVYTSAGMGTGVFAGGTSGPSMPFDRRCYVCGKSEGFGLDHRLGIRNCPDTDLLIREQLLMYHPTDGRLVRPDGRDLPRLGTLPNGLAAFLRSEIQGPSQSARQGRDRAAPQQSASCSMVGLYHNDKPVLSYPTTSHLTSASAYAYPAVTWSKGKDSERTARIEEVVEDNTMKTMHQSTTSSKQKVVAMPKTALPHPVNTEKGWKDVQNLKRQTRVEEVPEDSVAQPKSDISRLKIGQKGAGLRFTSDLQESVSIEALQEQILGTKVTLTLREVLAMSPHLQKRFQSLVKTRREFDPLSTKSGEVEACETDYVEGRPLDDTGVASVTFSPEIEDVEMLLERYADAVALGPKRSRRASLMWYSGTSELYSWLTRAQNLIWFLSGCGTRLSFRSIQMGRDGH
ncbi:hypothetical protein C8Q79DRAFT_964742 [Trametes meyenii]|nr:hypothetical protein C8Q79DRAFT_964742 [Trametes meyenii]